MPQQRGGGQNHRHRIRDVLAEQARRGIGEASAITTLGRRSGPNASSTDSAPAIEPKSCITKSDMQSPSRLGLG